jgi:hypothetical protein
VRGLFPPSVRVLGPLLGSSRCGFHDIEQARRGSHRWRKTRHSTRPTSGSRASRINVKRTVQRGVAVHQLLPVDQVKARSFSAFGVCPKRLTAALVYADIWRRRGPEYCSSF